jgi:hypothetical protein
VALPNGHGRVHGGKSTGRRAVTRSALKHSPYTARAVIHGATCGGVTFAYGLHHEAVHHEGLALLARRQGKREGIGEDSVAHFVANDERSIGSSITLKGKLAQDLARTLKCFLAYRVQVRQLDPFFVGDGLGALFYVEKVAGHVHLHLIVFAKTTLNFSFRSSVFIPTIEKRQFVFIHNLLMSLVKAPARVALSKVDWG